ncbi:hypothetical protein [Megasphaera sp.]|uniref:hypothetical protein n=1 Tax=Megasphaera sp. TaxID=2023260 RepID=UPI004026C22A
MKKLMTLTCSLCGKTYTEHAYRVGPLHECPECRAKIHDRYMLYKKRQHTDICIYCGQPLKNTNYGAMACGYKHSHRISSIEYRYRPRKRPSQDAVPKRRRKTKSHLALCIDEARTMGLSYGQYMAWKLTKGESEV